MYAARSCASCQIRHAAREVSWCRGGGRGGGGNPGRLECWWLMMGGREGPPVQWRGDFEISLCQVCSRVKLLGLTLL